MCIIHGSSFDEPDFPPKDRFLFNKLESCSTFSHFPVPLTHLNHKLPYNKSNNYSSITNYISPKVNKCEKKVKIRIIYYLNEFSLPRSARSKTAL